VKHLCLSLLIFVSWDEDEDEKGEESKKRAGEVIHPAGSELLAAYLRTD
jgi:hypothetical protein